ncbi:MAG: TIGR01212 family radical SAM protein [Bacteroidales bacterium]|nr:TIGR01212 family radical SAM protein [Bacteroidales bacterium]
MNPGSNYIWGHNRRWNSYTEYIRQLFGGRAQKLTIDAGFTCPNRDGSKGRGGCTYCNNDAFNPSYCVPEKSIRQQINEGIEFHRVRYRKATIYLAYFQAYSNTYAPTEVLREKYEEALENPLVKGLVIGTRPDCLDSAILDYLSELNERTYLTVELGIESCYDKTLEIIHRGHDFQTTLQAYEKCRERGIRAGGHLIIGLPGEGREEILHEAEILSGIPVNQLKFHQLQIVKGTRMADDFQKHPEEYMDYDLMDYLHLMSEFLEKLNPGIVVERIAGETVPAYNLRPSWGLRYDEIVRKFEEVMELRDSWQGKYYKA